MYRPVYDPVAGSVGLSALVAVLPLVVLFVLLGVVRMRAWLAALISLVAALAVAIAAYQMPVGQAFSAGLEGAAFGLFPIMWIVINALWIYQMTVATGDFAVLRRSFSAVSPDQRVQAVLIAFCFGALLEALAGFGTPVAICTVMLIAAGFTPLRAAVVALVANTAPVAFGAIAVPITTLASVTGLPVDELGAMVGRQTPVLALFVPFVLVGLVDGRRGLREAWPVALVGGLVFALAQYATSNFLSVELTDIVAALLSAAAVVILVRTQSRAAVPVTVGDASGSTSGEGDPHGRDVPAAEGGAADTALDGASGSADRGGPGADDPGPEPAPSWAAQVRAYLPYLIIIVIFGVQQIPPIKSAFDSVTVKFAWPGLHVVDAGGKAVSSASFTFNWLAAAGTMLLLAGLVTMLVLRISPRVAVDSYGQTLRLLATAIVTVAAVLALAYVMNLSGQTATLGRFVAGAGAAFAALSPILGWLGTALTGSDTSSNSLFGALQATAARDAGLSPLLLAASNSSGGVLGKMVSPQNLAIAAAAVGLAGREGDIFRRVLGWSLAFLVGMCLLVYLQSTAVLGWMVP